MDVDKLVEDNINLVYYQLHKQKLAYDEDAVSAAMEGLVEAAKTYNKDKNVRFSTYASVCIYNNIAIYLRHKCAKKKSATIVSFDETIYDNSDTTLSELVGDDSQSPETIIFNKELRSVLNKAMSKVYKSLPNEASKKIIRLWRKSNYSATQYELAEAAGVSQAHVSRTLSAFRHKLKKEMEEYLC